MADPFVAEIRLFAGNFVPTGWASCDGQLLPIAQNTALFSLLGITYGGDGRSNFALPNLQGRAPIHSGTGQGLTPRTLGEMGGQANVTLNETHLPAHSHNVMAANAPGSASTLEANVLAATPEDTFAPRGSKATVPMAEAALGVVGGGQAHNNMQPYLTLMFIIALSGIFPSRP